MLPPKETQRRPLFTKNCIPKTVARILEIADEPYNRVMMNYQPKLHALSFSGNPSKFIVEIWFVESPTNEGGRFLLLDSFFYSPEN